MNIPAERVVAGIRCSKVLEVLSELVDGELLQPERERVIAHLRGCDWCEKFGGRFTAVISSLRGTLRDAVPLRADVSSRLRERLTIALEKD